MQIKNFLTNDIKELEDFIIKELCKNGIQYTFIKEAHEIHFDKYIFRFYDNKSIFKIAADYLFLPNLEAYVEPIIGINEFIEKEKLRPIYRNPSINKILKRNYPIKNIKYNPKRFK